MILAPMAGRLKLMNILDYESKFNELKQEQLTTRNQLINIQSQISTYFSPIQQTNIFTAKTFEGLEKFLPVHKTLEDKMDKKTQKERFLKRAYQRLSSAYDILYIAIAFQVALHEHRVIEMTDYDYDEDDSTNVRINKMLKKLLDNGLETIFPVKLINENGEEKTLPVEQIAINLQMIPRLIELLNQVEQDQEVELTTQEIDAMFTNINDSLSEIVTSIVVIGSSSIASYYGITKAIEKVKEKYLGEGKVRSVPNNQAE